jgi:hypothetical protein
VSNINPYYVIIVTNNRSSGLDASVSFEADRPENLGLVLNSGPFGPQISFINATILGVSHGSDLGMSKLTGIVQLILQCLYLYL